MRSFLIFLLTVFSFLSYLSAEVSSEDKWVLSKIDEQFMDQIEDEEEVLLVKQFGDEKFSIFFPKKPSLSYEKIGEESRYDYSFKNTDQSFHFIVEDISDSDEEILYTFKKKFQGELISETKKSSSLGPMYEFISKKGDQFTKTQLYLLGDKLVQLVVQEKQLNSKESDQFFNSFKRTLPLK